MKLSNITLAVATLAASYAASAAAPAANEIAYAAGASAVQANFQAALADICNDTTGYQLSKLRANLLNINDNFVAYVCATAPVTAANYATATYKNFSAGIPFKEIRLNVDQGSFSAIQQIQDAPFPVFTLSYFDPAGANTASNITPNPTTITRLGGVLDVQPRSFPEPLLTGLNIPNVTDPLGVAQAFGVAVSRPLYEAMYNNQLSAGSATVAKPIPGTCGVGNALTTTDKIECIPTVSKGQMAAIMADNPFNTPNTIGAQFLGGAALAGSELGYARRVDTSGTQSAAQNYFLGNVCSTTQLGVVAQGTGTGVVPGALLRVYGLGSTGNVRAVLNDNTKYSIGVVSGENNQTGQTWKWVKVQGAPIGENASPSILGISNSAPVINGSYDFFYEAVIASYPSAIAATFWSEVKTKINGLVAPLGVGLIDDDALAAGFNKGGNTCQFNSSN